MFQIYDGRSSFYQWDLDRKLIIKDETVKEVHFCNKTDDCSLVCEVYKEGELNVVNVPNILLQDDWRINVYAYDGKYTKHSARYDVVRRSKPADYIYTETEVKRYEDLEARIEELEKNGGDGAVASVNGETGAVVLSAADVGAVPTSRTINGKSLTANISLSANDVNAISTSGGTITGSLTLGSTSNSSTYSYQVRKKINDTQYATGSVGFSNSDLRIQNSVSTKKSESTSYTTTSNSIVIGDTETSVSKPILFTTTAAKEDTRESLSVYSKAEVNNLIPEPYTLPVATAETMGGVKIGEGLEMVNGILGVVPEDKYELLSTVTVGAGGANKITFPDVSNLSAVMACITMPSSNNMIGTFLRANVSNGESYVVGSNYGSNDGNYSIRLEMYINRGILTGTAQGNVHGWGSAEVYGVNNAGSAIFADKISTIEIYCPQDNRNILEGTVINIYGVRL